MELAGWWLIRLLLLFNITYRVAGNLICLSCRGILSSSDCGLVEECGSHSVCYIDMIVASTGTIYFNMGCRDTLMCKSHRRRDSSTNSTELLYSSAYLHHNYQINMSKAEKFTHGSYERDLLKQSHENRVQRRSDNLACTHCCDKGNLCNVEGCGQIGFSPNRGPICFGCAQQVKPDSCREIQVCGRDDICYIEEISLGRDTVYHTTCRSKIKCHDSNIVMVKSAGILVGRDVNHINDVNTIRRQKRSLSPAKGCCQADMCNTILPQNGNWGPWTTWGSCSTSCGYKGTRQRTRKCEFPPPNYGGLPCVGGAFEVDTTCANSACSQGLICHSCKSSVSPRTCNYVETCGPNSVCYLEQYISHVGEIRYTSGCRDKLQCNNGVRNSKRFMGSGDYLSCTECCYGDLCNSHGCGEPRNSNRGPVCYSCSQQRDPVHCGQIDICDYGQRCGLVRHKFVDTFYQTMCLDKEKCVSDNAKSDDYPKCCTTSLCTFPSNTSQTGGSVATIISPTKPTSNGFSNPGFTTAPPTKTSAPHGFTTAPPTKTSGTNGFTTAPPTHTAHINGFTTAPPTNTAHTNGFTTAPPTNDAHTNGFTTAPPTNAAHTNGFTTAPPTNAAHTHGFTTAPPTNTAHTNGFTTAPPTNVAHTNGFTTAPPTNTAHTHGFTTAPPTNTALPTKPSNHAVGQWSDWGAWGPCLEPKLGVQGFRERERHCDNPIHAPPDSCTNGHIEHDHKYCIGGGPDACVPPNITDIKVFGHWALHRMVSLQCIVTGYPTPRVAWKTHTLETDMSVHQYMGDETRIVVGPIEQRHAGIYICEASNKCSHAAERIYNSPNFR